MKLCEWLDEQKRENGLTRRQFAARIGVSEGLISQICNSDRPWVSRETAEAIVRETGGEVTPNDFITIEPPKKKAREPARCSG